MIVFSYIVYMRIKSFYLTIFNLQIIGVRLSWWFVLRYGIQLYKCCFEKTIYWVALQPQKESHGLNCVWIYEIQLFACTYERAFNWWGCGELQLKQISYCTFKYKGWQKLHNHLKRTVWNSCTDAQFVDHWYIISYWYTICGNV